MDAKGWYWHEKLRIRVSWWLFQAVDAWLTLGYRLTKRVSALDAGAYRAPDYLGIDANIAKAREAAACLAREGIAFVSPHLNSAHFEVITPEVPEGWWLSMTLELLKRCDGVYVLDGSFASAGTQAEIIEAEERGMPVFFQAEYGSELDDGEWGNLLAWAKAPAEAKVQS